MTNPLSSPLHGQVLLITGAGDGLGRATAIAAAQAGATVVLLGRTIKKLEASYDAIEKLGGAQPAILPLHLNGAAWNDYQTVADTLETQLGRLDGLIHCAAHFNGFMQLAELPPKDWMDSVQVNLTAPYILTRCCLPLLLQAPRGRVVFTSDSGGRSPKALHGVYGVSKAALEALSAGLALEHRSLHPQMSFTTFNPGPMRTGLRLKGYAGEKPESIPLPDAAAQRLLSLLTQPAAEVSGKAL